MSSSYYTGTIKSANGYSHSRRREQQSHLPMVRPGFESMPDDVIANALSFLFSSETTDWQEAVHDFISIKCLNKALSLRLKKSILPAMSCSVDLQHFSNPSRVFYTLILLGRSQMKLDALHINGGYHDFDLLATLLSVSFDATSIRTLTISLPARPVPSRFIAPDAYHAYLPSSRAGNSRIGEFIDIPIEFSKMNLPTFLSLRCFQSLTTLKTSVLVNPLAWDRINDPMFQLTMLRSLDLKLAFISKPRTPISASLQTFSEVIHQMRNLEVLTLRASGCDSDRYGVTFMNSFALRSQTLRIANFHELPSGFFLRECQCPRLEIFTCRRSKDGNGVRPGDPAVFGNQDFGAEHEDYTVGSCPFFGMNVPRGCLVSFRGMQ